MFVESYGGFDVFCLLKRKMLRSFFKVRRGMLIVRGFYFLGFFISVFKMVLGRWSRGLGFRSFRGRLRLI